MYLAMEVLMVLLRLLLVVLVDFILGHLLVEQLLLQLDFWEHTVTVTDANIVLQLVTLAELNNNWRQLLQTLLQRRIQRFCFATPSGGAGGYTYSWSPSVEQLP
jgi:hypothetical protein